MEIDTKSQKLCERPTSEGKECKRFVKYKCSDDLGNIVYCCGIHAKDKQWTKKIPIKYFDWTK